MNQFLSKEFDLVEDQFRKIPGKIRNCGRWSKIAVVRLPDVELGIATIQTLLSIKVSGLFIFLTGCKISHGSIWEESESRNSFVHECWLYFNNSILMSQRRKTFLLSFDNLSSRRSFK